MPLLASLYNLARWLTQDRSEAEDLVQETFTKALRGFDSFQPETNFRAWIYRILRNTFLTSRTGLRASREVLFSEEEDDDGRGVEAMTVETPESILLTAAEHEVIASALEQLPIAQREIILLCDVEEMAYREIAEVLAIPIGTVMSRLARARKAVRQLLMQKDRSAPRLPVRDGWRSSTPMLMGSCPKPNLRKWVSI